MKTKIWESLLERMCQLRECNKQRFVMSLLRQNLKEIQKNKNNPCRFCQNQMNRRLLLWIGFMQFDFKLGAESYRQQEDMHSSIDTIRLKFCIQPFIKRKFKKKRQAIQVMGAKMRIQEEAHVLKRMKSKSWYQYRGIHARACGAQSKTYNVQPRHPPLSSSFSLSI